MNPWFSFWFKEFYLPWSGNVEQDINTLSNFLSPQLEINFAGNKTIEKDVIRDVASYGKQLGMLSEVVLELSKDHKSDSVTKLTQLVADIEKIKDRHRTRLEKVARESLDELKKQDLKAFEQLLAQYRK